MEVLDIRQLIGEATEYDKKMALEVKKPKSWCKSVSAFANGMGGRLIWGIADDDSLVGLADAKGDAEKISEIAAFMIGKRSCKLMQIKGNFNIQDIHVVVDDVRNM